VAFAGKIASVSCKVPLSVLILVEPPAPVTVMPVTGIICLVIVITKLPKTPEPSLAVALTVTVPLSIAETRPEEFIEARLAPVTMDQVTVLFVASDGRTSAVSCKEPLSVVIVLAPPAPETEILVTGSIWFEIVITIVP
jgi:hypothetical protein